MHCSVLRKSKISWLPPTTLDSGPLQIVHVDGRRRVLVGVNQTCCKGSPLTNQCYGSITPTYILYKSNCILAKVN